ncbi:hypothetical protein [Streptomyces goshikiensis]|uniref:hypothetical protein n=1 Tax=Streptomyces goshikiensis TaxID=1942 RepID=UPI00367DBE6D
MTTHPARHPARPDGMRGIACSGELDLDVSGLPADAAGALPLLEIRDSTEQAG